MQNALKVVIIEDTTAVLRLLTCYFEHRRSHVVATSDGLVGIRLISELLPDLVVCDHSVERTSGLHVLRKNGTRGGHCTHPLLYMSSDLSASAYEAAIRCGADAFLEKPFSLADIEAVIAEAL